jgi:hypothetical protein
MDDLVHSAMSRTILMKSGNLPVTIQFLKNNITVALDLSAGDWDQKFTSETFFPAADHYSNCDC